MREVATSTKSALSLLEKLAESWVRVLSRSLGPGEHKHRAVHHLVVQCVHGTLGILCAVEICKSVRVLSRVPRLKEWGAVHRPELGEHCTEVFLAVNTPRSIREFNIKRLLPSPWTSLPGWWRASGLKPRRWGSIPGLAVVESCWGRAIAKAHRSRRTRSAQRFCTRSPRIPRIKYCVSAAEPPTPVFRASGIVSC